MNLVVRWTIIIGVHWMMLHSAASRAALTGDGGAQPHMNLSYAVIYQKKCSKFFTNKAYKTDQWDSEKHSTNSNFVLNFLDTPLDKQNVGKQADLYVLL